MIIKVMTYNIQHGRGLDKKVSIKRIAAVINNESPDILGINEADQYNIRSLFVNQPGALAYLLKMNFFFGDNLKFWFMRYGNIALAKGNIAAVENIRLPGQGEPRGLVKATLDLGGVKIVFLCTHLGLTKKERSLQLEFMAGIIRDIDLPVIISGDFNCERDELTPILNLLQKNSEANTYPADKPVFAIDHIFWSSHFEIIEAYTVETETSDHLPLIARLKFIKNG